MNSASELRRARPGFTKPLALRVRATADAKPEGMDEKMTGKLSRAMTKGVGQGFLQDVEIWKNKTRIDNPLLVEEDGAVYQMRRWYSQFYVNKADVTAEMTDRFELEIDTSKANEFWHGEVDENLKRQADEKASAEAQAEAEAPAEATQS